MYMEKYCKYAIGLFLLASLSVSSCNSKDKPVDTEEILVFADTQIKGLLDNLNEEEVRFPRSLQGDGSLKTVGLKDWTSGFFPGSLWYLYDATKEEFWKQKALLWTKKLEPLQYFTSHHDIGFMMYCSYGNAYRLLKDESHKAILINAAKSLCTRYYPEAGVIRSWDYKRSHKGTDWHCPVIIDNMMNLELLFFAAKETGDESFRKIAIRHAEETIKNHLRSDYSSYHVVNYDTITGQVLDRDTYQGLAENSAWSRGQAWGIYGFTMTYRETRDQRFLETAKKMADFFIHHPNLPDDNIPYWDMNAGQAGYTPDFAFDPGQYNPPPRDISAAAIIASALIELSEYAEKEGKLYFETAEKMLRSMSSPGYTAQAGQNGNFILMHYVGNFSSGPDRGEIDRPCVYADYYYLEALLRYQKRIGQH